MNIFDSNGENNIPALNQKENQDINLNLIQNSNTSKDDIEIKIYDYLTRQYNSIMSYYYTTCKYLLNCEQNFNASKIKRSSKNFVLKDKLKLNYQNKINDNNYNENNIKNCENKNTILKYVNNNEIKRIDNAFINKCSIKNNHFLNNPNDIVINNTINQQKIINLNNATLFKSNPKIPYNIINNDYSYQFYNPFNNLTLKNIELHKPNIEYNLKSQISQKKEEKKIDEFETLDYHIVMFGRRGWICKLCNNFNYESRTKCNRCGVIKNPKIIAKINQKSDKDNSKRLDWKCVFCSNLNYSFRTTCNRFKLKYSTNNQILSSLF